MVATLTKASPAADFALGEFVIAPPTVKLFDDDTPELDYSPRLVPAQKVAESELSFAKPAAATPAL